MKRAIIYRMAIAFGLAAFGLGLRPAHGANFLENIGVSRDGDSVVVTITSTQAGEFKTFLTEAKPERIVIDLSSVSNTWSPKEFRELPLRSIKSIRTSQYMTTPDLVARVVLDIERPIDFRSYRNGNNVVVKLPVVPDEVEFARWQARGQSTPEEPAQAAEPPEQPEESEAAEVPAPAEPAAPVTAPMPSITNPLPSAAQGVQVEPTPRRRTIEYSASGKDPFMPLVGAGGGQMVEGLPSLENLKLVGILEDREGNRALLEDGEGNGYILKANDRIRGGFVVSVTETKAVFQVTEYGWTRTVALELEIPEIK